MGSAARGRANVSARVTSHELLMGHQDFTKRNGFSITLGHWELLKASGGCAQCGRILRGDVVPHEVTGGRTPGHTSKQRQSWTKLAFCPCCLRQRFLSLSGELRQIRAGRGPRVSQRRHNLKVLVPATCRCGTKMGPGDGYTVNGRATCEACTMSRLPRFTEYNARSKLQRKREANCQGCPKRLAPGEGWVRFVLGSAMRAGFAYTRERVNLCTPCVLRHEEPSLRWLRNQLRGHGAACTDCALSQRTMYTDTWRLGDFRALVSFHEVHTDRTCTDSPSEHQLGICTTKGNLHLAGFIVERRNGITKAIVEPRCARSLDASTTAKLRRLAETNLPALAAYAAANAQ
jgi:hypothetical protein